MTDSGDSTSEGDDSVLEAVRRRLRAFEDARLGGPLSTGDQSTYEALLVREAAILDKRSLQREEPIPGQRTAAIMLGTRMDDAAIVEALIELVGLSRGQAHAALRAAKDEQP
jgi:hypothetical protein